MSRLNRWFNVAVGLVSLALAITLFVHSFFVDGWDATISISASVAWALASRHCFEDLTERQDLSLRGDDAVRFIQALSDAFPEEQDNNV